MWVLEIFGVEGDEVTGVRVGEIFGVSEGENRGEDRGDIWCVRGSGEKG